MNSPYLIRATNSKPVAVATLESLWVCRDCGWVMAYDDPAIREVYCVACFREGRGKDHRCEALPVPESGGTVGPLPDGTVIEVERVTWNVIADEIGTLPRFIDGTGEVEGGLFPHEALAAFNARQS